MIAADLLRARLFAAWRAAGRETSRRIRAQEDRNRWRDRALAAELALRQLPLGARTPGMCRTLADCVRVCHRLEQAETLSGVARTAHATRTRTLEPEEVRA
jgi:hypothetical protein